MRHHTQLHDGFRFLGFVSQYLMPATALLNEGWKKYLKWSVKAVSALNALSRSLIYNCAVPIIVVFTKYDKLVTTKIMEGNTETLSDEDAWRLGETQAEKAFQGLCIDPLTAAVGRVRVMQVSSGYHGGMSVTHP
jgi:hypothetical protein